jgi:hypothetical protein
MLGSGEWEMNGERKWEMRASSVHNPWEGKDVRENELRRVPDTTPAPATKSSIKASCDVLEDVLTPV